MEHLIYFVQCNIKSSFITISFCLLIFIFCLITIIKIYKGFFPNKNNKILKTFVLLNLYLSLFYFSNEIFVLPYFKEFEMIFLNLLYALILTYFFRNLLLIEDNKIYSFYSILILLSIFVVFSLIRFIFGIKKNDCNFIFIQIEILINLICIFIFLYIANSWVNSLIRKYFSEFNIKKNNELRFVNKHSLLERLLKFRLLIFIYFFLTNYYTMKIIFFYFLNFGNDFSICFNLYQEDKQLRYYEYFDKEKIFFKIANDVEYFINILFGYILPNLFIFDILRLESNKEVDLSQKSVSTNSLKDENLNDLVKGLKFEYN